MIRDGKIFEHDESLIEVCDNRQEIVNFSTKELLNMALELLESDGRDLDVYADMIELIYSLAEMSLINCEQIDDLVASKLETYGGYSKYLLKIERN